MAKRLLVVSIDGADDKYCETKASACPFCCASPGRSGWHCCAFGDVQLAACELTGKSIRCEPCVTSEMELARRDRKLVRKEQP